MRTRPTVHRRQRVAAVLDLENLLHAVRHEPVGVLHAAFRRIVADLDAMGLLVHAVAVCDRGLAARLVDCPEIRRVRVHTHHGGVDAADLALLDRAADLPPSASIVVIGSGDHSFAPLVHTLNDRGVTTVVLGPVGQTAKALERGADAVLCAA